MMLKVFEDENFMEVIILYRYVELHHKNSPEVMREL